MNNATSSPNCSTTTNQTRAIECHRCGAPFTPRTRSGGKPQQYCGEHCRRAADAERKALKVQRAQRAGAPEELMLPQLPDVKFLTDGVLVIQQRDTSGHENCVVISADNVSDFFRKLQRLCGTA